MRNKKIFVSVILLLIFCSLLIFSIIKIINWNIDNHAINKEIEFINENSTLKEIDNSIYTNIIDDSNYINEKFLQIDFNSLLVTNSDVVGWINIPNTNINYPFVQTSNNNYYLNHSFNKSWNDAGWVFLDYRNDIDELDANTIIYAHGRVDGTMFGSLKNTLNEDWLSNKNNYVVKISTLSNNYIFEVFSIYHINTTNDYLYNNFLDIREYNEFLTKLKNRSIYNFETEVATTDKILTLSTCYNNFEKLVLHAKLIKEQKRY